jgi:hypothetical protein
VPKLSNGSDGARGGPQTRPEPMHPKVVWTIFAERRPKMRLIAFVLAAVVVSAPAAAEAITPGPQQRAPGSDGRTDGHG